MSKGELSRALRQAFSDNDLNKAVRHSASLRSRFPDERYGWQGGVVALRKTGRCEESEALALEASDRFPDFAWFCKAAVELAIRRQDWPTAAARSLALRQLFPDDPAGYSKAHRALIALDRIDEAEAVVAEGLARFASEAWPHKHALECALKRQDWATAAARSLALRQQFPDDPAGYSNAHRALIALDRIDEAEAVAAEGLARFASEAWPHKHALECALKRQDWASAEVRAEELRVRAPADPVWAEGGLVALCQQRRLEQARELAALAMSAFPDRLEVKRAAARLASFDRFMDADAGLAGLARAAHNDLAPRLAWARHANTMMREQFGWGAVVLDRLRALHAHFPDADKVITAYVSELSAQGHHGAADQASAPYLSRLGSFPALALAWVNVAHRSRAFDEAARRARAARELLPDRSKFAAAEVRALVALIAGGAQERHEEVEVICAEALRAFPDEEELYDFHGLLAQLDGDLHKALARWQAGLRRFAGVAWQAGLQRFAGVGLRGHFRRRILDANLALESAAAVPGAVVNESALQEESQLMVRFQSLGSTLFGCEFGGVQRYFGAEPLHLLRWTSCPIGQLIHGVGEKFAAFGMDDDLTIHVYRNEYKVRSARYRMRLHTSIRPSEASQEKALLQMRRRCLFLARRLDEELTLTDWQAKPIFVYKHYIEHVSDDEGRELFAALNRHGRNALLSVRRADDANPAGTVRMVEPFFMIGYLEHFGKTALGIPLKTPNRSWLRICSTAAQMADELINAAYRPAGSEASA